MPFFSVYFCLTDATQKSCRQFLCVWKQFIGDSGRAVFNIDGAAPVKAVFLGQMLHGFVVPVGIYPDMRTQISTKFKAGGEDTAGAIGSDPVPMENAGPPRSKTPSRQSSANVP